MTHGSEGNNLLELLAKDSVKMFLGVNQHEGIWYYSKEKFEELVDWMFTLSSLEMMKDEIISIDEVAESFKELYKHFQEILEISKWQNINWNCSKKS